MTGAHKRRDPLWRRPAIVAAVAVVAVAVLALTIGWAVSDDEPARAAEEPKGTPTPSQDQTPRDDPDAIDITAVGDTIMGTLPDKLPSDSENYFDGVAEHLKGDVVFGNLEGVLSKSDDHKKCKPKDKCFYVRMPPEYASVLADTGFTVMNGANNHAWDSGPQGHAETQTALDEAGIGYAGIKGEIVETQVNGTTVATIGFATYYHYDSLLDLDVVSQMVTAASQQADVVVVSMHLGAEGTKARHTPQGSETFHGEDRGDSQAATHAAVDAGADLVLGHGPHVLRGMEFYKGRLIAHSLGNFAGYGVLKTDGALGRGVILRASLDPKGEWVSGKAVASRMVDGGYPAVDKTNKAFDDINSLSADDFADTAVTIEDSGTIAAP